MLDDLLPSTLSNRRRQKWVTSQTFAEVVYTHKIKMLVTVMLLFQMFAAGADFRSRLLLIFCVEGTEYTFKISNLILSCNTATLLDSIKTFSIIIYECKSIREADRREGKSTLMQKENEAVLLQ